MKTSTHLLAFGVALVALATSGPAFANRPYGPAETLVWEGRYLGITVAHATLMIGAPTDISGEKVWPILGIAKTEPYFVMWPVKNRYVTWFNPATGLSVGSEYFVDENHKQRRERTRFDRAAAKATVVRDRPGEARTEDTYDVQATAVDLLTAILALRDRKLEVGDKEEVPVFTGKTAFTMKAEVLRKESIEVPAGKFDTVVLSVDTRFSGKTAANSIHLYISDDERHLPVRLDADFLFGAIVSDLVSYQKGVTHP